MEIYFFSGKKNINTYLLINTVPKEAILIDPCDIVQYFIEKLEDEHILLKAVCITNPHIEEIKRGIKSWLNIYDFSIFNPLNVFHNSKDYVQNFQFSSFNVESFYIKTHSNPFCMYKLENALFTGESLLASFFQFSSPSRVDIQEKMKAFVEETIIFPLSGPPTTLKNLRLKETSLNIK